MYHLPYLCRPLGTVLIVAPRVPRERPLHTLPMYLYFYHTYLFTTIVDTPASIKVTHKIKIEPATLPKNFQTRYGRFNFPLRWYSDQVSPLDPFLKPPSISSIRACSDFAANTWHFLLVGILCYQLMKYHGMKDSGSLINPWGCLQATFLRWSYFWRCPVSILSVHAAIF